MIPFNKVYFAKYIENIKPCTGKGTSSKNFTILKYIRRVTLKIYNVLLNLLLCL